MHRTTCQANGICFFFVLNWSKGLPYVWLGQWMADNLATSALPRPPAHVGLLVIGVKLLYDVPLAA